MSPHAARAGAALVALALAACAGAEPPPSNALDVTCATGTQTGGYGVMDWVCVDGDGERRLPVRSLHEVIEGDELPAEREAREAREAGDAG